MIEYAYGDILKADAEALVNTVNCVGVMGRGIALQFKKAFPENFKAYAAACKRDEVHPGKMFVFPLNSLMNPRYIINFPTKRHWKAKSKTEDIEAGLKALVSTIQQYDIRSLAIPPLGSGLGGLEWKEVKPLIIKSLDSLSEIRIVIYEPQGAPSAKQMVHSKKKPTMTVGRAVLVELINRYLRGLLDPSITLLEIHKLMYFMQEAGEPLRLRYKKALYGPYAENLGKVLHVIEGHLLSGYADGGDTPYKQIELLPGAIESANQCLHKHPETLSRFNKVSNLVEGFESSFALELLSTVHWVFKYENLNSFEEVLERTHAWNERKKQFTPRQIQIALDVLTQQNWI